MMNQLCPNRRITPLKKGNLTTELNKMNFKSNENNYKNKNYFKKKNKLILLFCFLLNVKNKSVH
jgi:hypothetical protein